jgi:hypothetical protein
MTDLEYLLVTSIAPIGALIIAAMLMLMTREKPRRPHPGE